VGSGFGYIFEQPYVKVADEMAGGYIPGFTIMAAR
jgi:hypothetical protein